MGSLDLKQVKMRLEAAVNVAAKREQEQRQAANSKKHGKPNTAKVGNFKEDLTGGEGYSLGGGAEGGGDETPFSKPVYKEEAGFM